MVVSDGGCTVTGGGGAVVGGGGAVVGGGGVGGVNVFPAGGGGGGWFCASTGADINVKVATLKTPVAHFPAILVVFFIGFNPLPLRELGPCRRKFRRF